MRLALWRAYGNRQPPGAISAIDIALWDIKARRYGVRIYELMGDGTRDRVRCYMHARGNTLDELVADAVAKKRHGFTAIRFSPFAPDYHLRKSFEEAQHRRRSRQARRAGVVPAARVRRARELADYLIFGNVSPRIV